MERYPSYNPRDYPAGVSDFVNTFPPERRKEVFSAIFELHLRRKLEEEWVRRQVRWTQRIGQVAKIVNCS